jgi:hypothetical protein
MKDAIYKFLDLYVGTSVVVSHTDDKEFYKISSKDGTIIFTFRVNVWNKFSFFRNNELSKTVSGFFTIENQDAIQYIDDWFRDRHEITQDKDFLTFCERWRLYY